MGIEPMRIPDPPRALSVESPLIRAPLAACSADATKLGVFGDVVVVMEDPNAPRVQGSPSLGAHRERLEKCVRQVVVAAVASIARRTDLSAPAPHWPRSLDVTVGRPQPLLPPLETLLPAWDRLLGAPSAGAGSARSALLGLLPPGITLRPDGCLSPVWQGSSTMAALDLWARTSQRAMHPLWYAAKPFAYSDHPGFVALVVADDRLVVGDLWQSERKVCQRVLAPGEVQSLWTEVNEKGRCWVGPLAGVLTSPRFEFPKEGNFKTVSMNRTTACGLDREGHIQCCGKTLGPPAPAESRWRAITMRALDLCAVDDRGKLVCFGEPAGGPGLKNLRAVSQGDGPVCAVDMRDRLTCTDRILVDAGNKAPRPRAVFPGPVAQCLESPWPAKRCEWVVEVESSGREWPRVKKVAASPWGACAIAKDDRLTCKSRAGAFGDPGAFREVTMGQGGLACGLKADGSLSCWSLSDNHAVPVSAARKFASLASTIGADGVCGLDLEGKVLCAEVAAPGSVERRLDIQAPDDSFAMLATSGGGHCGVKADGTIRCWGDLWPPRNLLRGSEGCGSKPCD